MRNVQGGKEHGVPIIVSEIHDNMPAQRCKQLYVGDAILSVNKQELQNATHGEAVHVLSRVHGDITMEVLYVDVEDSADEDTWEEDANLRYTTFEIIIIVFIVNFNGATLHIFFLNNYTKYIYTLLLHS